MLSIYKAIAAGKWNQVFSGNRTILRIVNVMNIGPPEEGGLPLAEFKWRHAMLPGVLKLDMSSRDGNDLDRFPLQGAFVEPLSTILPNVRELDMGSLNVEPSDPPPHWPNLSRITWKSSFDIINLMGGGRFLLGRRNLKELYLDDTWFNSTFLVDGFYLLKYCRSLERLSIKGAMFRIQTTTFWQPVHQAMLMEMVRHHCTLRWLRSDLTPENVAILQQERPEVTFVTE